MSAKEDSAENGEMRSKEAISRIVEGFTKSGMTRREYCAKHGVAMTTLDHWRRRVRTKPRLVKVELARPEAAGFTLRLANGRAIEGCLGFAEEDLARLIRIAERA